jgi:glycerophosphoryl diester phosphodiesterase
MSSQSLHRIGHGGASALVPANTLQSFDVARSIGIDMIEFDLRGWRGQLVLAHTILDARRPGSVQLDDALSYLAGRRFAEIELNVDLKQLGCEAAVLEALRRHRLLARTLISCQLPRVVDRVRALDPHARTGISIGGPLARLSRRWTGWRAQVLAGLAARRWDALMIQYRLVDGQLVRDVVNRGGSLYAWTANERGLIERLRADGVHGITTADPRLFQAPSSAAAT